jgi:hypothetical protein
MFGKLALWQSTLLALDPVMVGGWGSIHSVGGNVFNLGVLYQRMERSSM